MGGGSGPDWEEGHEVIVRLRPALQGQGWKKSGLGQRKRAQRPTGACVQVSVVKAHRCMRAGERSEGSQVCACR